MADDQLFLTDGVDLLDLFDFDRSLVLRGDNSLGDVEEGSNVRTMVYRCRFGSLRGGDLTDRVIREQIAVARRLLTRAKEGLRDDPVQLFVRLAGASEATVFDVVGGAVEEQDHLGQPYMVDRKAHATLRVFTRPYGRTAEVTLMDTAPYSGASVGVTHVYASRAGGTLISRNLMAQRDGTMWTNGFTFDSFALVLSNPAVGDWIAWGNAVAPMASWDRVTFGIQAAQSGITGAVLEMSTAGGTWTALPAGSWQSSWSSDGTPTHLFDTVKLLGSLSWDPGALVAAGWTNGTIVSQSAPWIRWRITAIGATPVAPSMCNGPYRSLYGMPWVPGSDVGGDEYAGALLNIQAGQLHAGYSVAIVPGRTFNGVPTTEPPPLNIELQSADAVQGGATTVTDIVADTNASGGEALRVQVNATYADAALKMVSGENAILTPVPSKLLTPLNGSASWAVEWYGTLDSIDGTRTILSAWDGVANIKRFWLGIDGGRISALASDNGQTVFRIRSSITPTKGKHVLRIEWDQPNAYLRLYVDNILRGSRRMLNGVLNAAQVAFMLGNVVSWDNGVDSYNQLTMGAFVGTHSLVRFLDAAGLKTWPATKVQTSQPPAGTGVIARWAFDDAGSTSAITDTATTPANMTFRVGTTATAWSTRRIGGFFQGAGEAGTVMIGVKLPRTLLEEYGEITYRFLLFVKAVAPLQADMPTWQLQLSKGGDPQAPYVTKVPAKHLVATPPSDGSFDVIDLGVATLPPADMFRDYRGGNGVADYQWAYIFMAHPWTTLGVMTLDRLVLLPLRYGTMEFRSWPFGSPDSVYNSANAVQIGEGLTIDGRREQRRISQVYGTGYLDQRRNPFARAVGDAPTLWPGLPHFFYILPYGSWNPTADDSPLTMKASYGGTLRVLAEPKWRTLGTT